MNKKQKHGGDMRNLQYGNILCPCYGERQDGIFLNEQPKDTPRFLGNKGQLCFHLNHSRNSPSFFCPFISARCALLPSASSVSSFHLYFERSSHISNALFLCFSNFSLVQLFTRMKCCTTPS